MCAPRPRSHALIIALARALLFGTASALSAAPAPSATSAAPAAAATSFVARVLRGRLIEAASTGPAYQKILWAQLDGPTTTTLTACIKRNAPADKSPFTLVADVHHDGTPSAVVVQPATPVATCLAAWFRTTTLPPPPSLPDTSTYPLEIDVTITP